MKHLRNAALGLALFLGFENSAHAQVSAYTFAQSTGTYTAISGGTVLGTATANSTTTNLNSEVYPVTLPFNFNFNGNSYSSLNVTTNGFVTFGATAPSATNITPISNVATYDGVIAAWGRDISSFFDVAGKTGTVKWNVTGTAPNREVIIQWENFRVNSATAVTSVYSFSFQIRLQETSNVIKIVYDAGSYLVVNTAITSTAQIGLRGYSAADFNNRLNASTLEFVNSTPGTAAASTQYHHTTNAVPGMPPAGFTYTWTPPTCFIPNGLSAGTSTSNSASVSWSATLPTPAGGYDIYYSTSSTPPTSSTAPIQQGITGLTYTLSSLNTSTGYYIYIRSNCGGGTSSSWSEGLLMITQCQAPNLLSSTGATACPNQSAVLSATAASGAVITWYDAAIGGSSVNTGSPFTTPALASTTNYWVTAANIGSDQFLGKATPVSTSGNSGFSDVGLSFDAYSAMRIKQVDLYPIHATNTTGTVTISLKNSAGTVLATKTVTVNVAPTPGVLNTVTLDFDVPSSGTGYRLVVDGATGITTLIRESAATAINFPYVSSFGNITSAWTANAPSAIYYYYLYNWKIQSKCESARTMVTATVDSACLSTSENEAKNAVKVYPNPFSDVINITQPELVKSISIADATGRLIKNNLKPESVLRLNDLPNGIYIMILDMKNGSKQTVKVVKK